MPTPKISLLPEKLDLALYAGDGAVIMLAVQTNAGAALDVAGVVTAQIRKARVDVAALADFAVDSSGSALGIVTISLTGEQTAALITDENNFKGVWDVQWVPTDLEPVTLLQGKVECNADVTR